MAKKQGNRSNNTPKQDWQWMPVEKYVDGKLRTVYVKARKVGYPQSHWEAVEYDANGNYRAYAKASDAKDVQNWIVNNSRAYDSPRVTSNNNLTRATTKRGEVRYVDLNKSKDFNGTTGYKYYDPSGNEMGYTRYEYDPSLAESTSDSTGTYERTIPSLVNEGINIDFPTVKNSIPDGFHETMGVLFPNSSTREEEDEILRMHYDPKEVQEYRTREVQNNMYNGRIPTSGGGFTTQAYIDNNPDAYTFGVDDPSNLGAKDPLFWLLAGGRGINNGAFTEAAQLGKSAYNFGKDKLIAGIGEEALANTAADLGNIWSVLKYPVYTGFGIQGANSLMSDHGLKRTWDLGKKTFNEDWRYAFPLLGSAFGDALDFSFMIPSTKLYGNLYRNLGNKAIDTGLEAASKFGNTTARDWRIARAITGDVNEAGKPLMSWEEAAAEDANNARKELGLEPVKYEPSEAVVRTKVGDVEIDNPQLAYRQGKDIAQDFVDTGEVAVKESPAATQHINKEIPKRPDGHPIFTFEDFDQPLKAFPNPMFSQGQLWYGLPTEAGNDLLVTAEPLAIGTHYANRVKSDLNGTFDLRSGYGKSGRRVPLYEEQLNASNTAAYTWEPGYGYRKVVQESPMVSWEEAASQPTVTETIARQNAEAMRARAAAEETANGMSQATSGTSTPLYSTLFPMGNMADGSSVGLIDMANAWANKMGKAFRKGTHALNMLYGNGLPKTYERIKNIKNTNKELEEQLIAPLEAQVAEAEERLAKIRQLQNSHAADRLDALQEPLIDSLKESANSIPISQVDFSKMSAEDAKKFFSKYVFPMEGSPVKWDNESKKFIIEEVTGTQEFNPREAVSTGALRLKDFKTGKEHVVLLDDATFSSGQTKVHIEYDPVTDELVEFSEKLPSKIVKPQIPDEYKNLIKSNTEYVTKELLPGSKKFGSVSNVESGNLYHLTDDVDVIMTEKQALNHPEFKNWWNKRPDTYEWKHPEAGKIDINVIREDSSGMAKGDLAHELYAQLHPEEYLEHMLKLAKEGKTLNTDVSLPISADKLLQEYDPVTKGIVDAFASSKQKHMGRAVYYLHYGDVKTVRKGFNAYANYILGGKYKPSNIPLSEFSNAEVNSKIIDELGLQRINKEQFIHDPERMKLLVDYAVFDKTFVGRGIEQGQVDNVINSLTKWYPNTNGGTAGGVGLNTVLGGDSRHGDLYETLIPGRMRPLTAENVPDLLKQIENNIGNRILSAEEQAKVLELAKKHNVPMGTHSVTDFRSLISATSGARGENYKAFINDLAKEFDRDVILNGDYGNGTPHALLLEDQEENGIRQLFMQGMDRPVTAESRDRALNRPMSGTDYAGIVWSIKTAPQRRADRIYRQFMDSTAPESHYQRLRKYSSEQWDRKIDTLHKIGDIKHRRNAAIAKLEDNYLDLERKINKIRFYTLWGLGAPLIGGGIGALIKNSMEHQQARVLERAVENGTISIDDDNNVDILDSTKYERDARLQHAVETLNRNKEKENNTSQQHYAYGGPLVQAANKFNMGGPEDPPVGSQYMEGTFPGRFYIPVDIGTDIEIDEDNNSKKVARRTVEYHGNGEWGAHLFADDGTYLGYTGATFLGPSEKSNKEDNKISQIADNVYGQGRVPTPGGGFTSQAYLKEHPDAYTFGGDDASNLGANDPLFALLTGGRSILNGGLKLASQGLKSLGKTFDKKVLEPAGDAVYNYFARKVAASPTLQAAKVVSSNPYVKAANRALWTTVGYNGLKNGEHSVDNTVNSFKKGYVGEGLENLTYNALDASMMLPVIGPMFKAAREAEAGKAFVLGNYPFFGISPDQYSALGQVAKYPKAAFYNSGAFDAADTFANTWLGNKLLNSLDGVKIGNRTFNLGNTEVSDNTTRLVKALSQATTGTTYNDLKNYFPAFDLYEDIWGNATKMETFPSIGRPIHPYLSKSFSDYYNLTRPIWLSSRGKFAGNPGLLRFALPEYDSSMGREMIFPEHVDLRIGDTSGSGALGFSDGESRILLDKSMIAEDAERKFRGTFGHEFDHILFSQAPVEEDAQQIIGLLGNGVNTSLTKDEAALLRKGYPVSEKTFDLSNKKEKELFDYYTDPRRGRLSLQTTPDSDIKFIDVDKLASSKSPVTIENSASVLNEAHSDNADIRSMIATDYNVNTLSDLKKVMENMSIDEFYEKYYKEVSGYAKHRVRTLDNMSPEERKEALEAAMEAVYTIAKNEYQNNNGYLESGVNHAAYGGPLVREANMFRKGGPKKKRKSTTKPTGLTPWPALNNIEFQPWADPTFTRDKTGVGDIEVMFKDTPEEGILYGTNYNYPHPLPGQNVVIFNPATNDEQDIRLDALHIMPQDPTYDVLRSRLAYYGDDSDLAFNAERRMQEDMQKYGKLQNTPKQYYLNEVDGFLRNMLIEGTPEYIESRRYFPDKQKLREWNAPLMPYVDAIQQYLETGEKPPYVLDEVVVNGNTHAEGGQMETPKQWSDLSAKEKADMMKVAIRNGITDLSAIKEKYNEFTKDVNTYGLGGSERGYEQVIADMGTRSKWSKSAESLWSKARPMYIELLNAGIDPVAAAGILGNIAVESRFHPDAANNIKGGHFGYLQNDKNITSFVEANFGGRYEHAPQMAYLIAGLQGKLPKKNLGLDKRFNNFNIAMRNVRDPKEAARLWDQLYEISGRALVPQRQFYAQYFYDKMMQNNPSYAVSDNIDYATASVPQQDYSYSEAFPIEYPTDEYDEISEYYNRDDVRRNLAMNVARMAEADRAQERAYTIAGGLIKSLISKNKKDKPSLLSLVSPLFNFAAQGGTINRFDYGGPEKNTAARIGNAAKGIAKVQGRRNPLSKSFIGRSVHSDHEFYKLLPQLFAADGVSIKISSGYRPGARTAQGLPSRHATEGSAADIVPINQSTFADILKVLDDPNSTTAKWLLANGYGYLNETIPDVMKTTGATGPHFHIGLDSGLASKYAKRMNYKYNPKVVPNYTMPTPGNHIGPALPPVEEYNMPDMDLWAQENTYDGQWDEEPVVEDQFYNPEEIAKRNMLAAQMNDENRRRSLGLDIAMGLIDRIGQKEGKQRNTSLLNTLVPFGGFFGNNMTAYGGPIVATANKFELGGPEWLQVYRKGRNGKTNQVWVRANKQNGGYYPADFNTDTGVVTAYNDKSMRSPVNIGYYDFKNYYMYNPNTTQNNVEAPEVKQKEIIQTQPIIAQKEPIDNGTMEEVIVTGTGNEDNISHPLWLSPGKDAFGNDLPLLLKDKDGKYYEYDINNDPFNQSVMFQLKRDLGRDYTQEEAYNWAYQHGISPFRMSSEWNSLVRQNNANRKWLDFVNWNRRASGAITPVYPEFYLLTAGRGGMNGAFKGLNGLMTSEYRPIIDSVFGTQAALNLASENGFRKTLDYVGKGDWERALYSGIGDAWDLTLGFPILRTPYNVYKNIQFARSDAPMQLMKDVKKASYKNLIGSNAYKGYIDETGYTTKAIRDEYAKTANPTVSFSPSEFLKVQNDPIRLFSVGASNLNGERVVVNPLSFTLTPKQFKGLLGHEFDHTFQVLGKELLSTPTSAYWGPNPFFSEYELIKPFEKAAKKGKWSGSPDELSSEMVNWKIQNGELFTPYWKMTPKQRSDYVTRGMWRFKLNEEDMSRTLNGLSNLGYFDKGGKISK